MLLSLPISASAPAPVHYYNAHSDLQLSTSILDLMILGTGRNLMIVPEVSTQNQGLKGHVLFPTLIPASSHIHTREISVFCIILLGENSYKRALISLRKRESIKSLLYYSGLLVAMMLVEYQTALW